MAIQCNKLHQEFDFPMNLLEVKFRQDFSQQEVNQTRQSILEVEGSAKAAQSVSNETVSPSLPFLVVTPLGMPQKDLIDNWLKTHGYLIERRTEIPNWASTSTLLYPKTLDDERIQVALGFQILWRMATLVPDAERWELSQETDMHRLNLQKEDLRAECGNRRYCVNMPSTIFHARLQAIHVPDPERFAWETLLIDASLNQ